MTAPATDAPEVKIGKGRKKGGTNTNFPLQIDGVGSVEQVKLKKIGFPGQGGPHGPSAKFQPLIDAVTALEPGTDHEILQLSVPEGQDIEALRSSIRMVINKYVKPNVTGKSYKVRTTEDGKLAIVCSVKDETETPEA
jgi:hypothetical protein